MPYRWRWILTITTATALDLAARFGAAFDFGRVMRVEAILFPLTAVVLATLLHRDPGSATWSHVVRIACLWLFALGGLRPVLWTLGLPLMAANLITLGAALLGLVVWLIRCRRTG
jgi:hypothetical protein